MHTFFIYFLQYYYGELTKNVFYFSLIPVFFKLHEVIKIINFPPAVDIYSSCSRDDQYHEAQFDQVANLHQHGSCNKWHYSHEAVVFGILRTVAHSLHHKTRRAVENLERRWNAAELKHKRQYEYVSQHTVFQI